MAQPKTLPQAAALEMQEDINSWLRTKTALSEVLTNHVNILKSVPGIGMNEAEMVNTVLSWMPVIMEQESYAVGGNSPTFCSPDYTSMLHTMTASAPKDAMRAIDLTQPSGFLVFADPFTLELPEGVPDLERVRAFSWYIRPGMPGGGAIGVFTRIWSETKRSQWTPQIMSRHKVFPAAAGLTLLGPDNGSEDNVFSRMLQAHFALLRSPMSSEESAVRNPKTNPRTKRSLGDDIRRIYLRRPEVAQYEADEAAAAREGRAPMRAHWVRGHWRNQRYARSGENRWIWIDGFIKGNAENGTVTTRKVGVARASASELRKLVTA